MNFTETLRSQPDFRQLCDLVPGTPPGSDVFVLGLQRSARYPVAAALYEAVARPILYVTETSEKALLAYDEIGFWCPQADRYVFPAPEPLFYEHAGWSPTVHHDRIQTLAQLIRCQLPGLEKPERSPLVIAPVRALMTRTLSRQDFIHHSRNLRAGQEISPAQLMKLWAETGYEPVDTVLESGQFCKRGGLLDVWPHSEAYPIRIDFFGDEIDSIHRFDPSTQRNFVLLQKAFVPPAAEVIPSLDPAVSIPPQTPAEFYLPLLEKDSVCLMDFLPKSTLILLEDGESMRIFGEELEKNAEDFREQCLREGTLDDSYPEPYVCCSEIEDRFNDHPAFDLGHSDEPEDEALSSSFEPEQRFGGQLPNLVDYLRECSLNHESVIVISRQADRIKDLWEQTPQHLSIADAPEFISDSIAEGFRYTGADDAVTHVLTDSEIFGWERPVPRKNQQKIIDTPEKYYADLKVGDFVVHVDYGIGIYDGLVTRTLNGVNKDFLRINYAQGDQLFVPVHQADRLSNYVGPNGKEPEITRLGTRDWLTAKTFVRENVLEIANDLLDLYAKRQVTEGFAFSPDGAWMQDLEGAFPFEETEDQKTAIRKVKEDMESSRPMDRLICGDVGFGKTEIALRAAFKAACDSKQVAVLVPTTVLAQQHYETFRKRFAAYPVRVEMLSRFRTAAEQKKILKKLKEGEIDVIIGTHRLVSKDVQFKDLGLVVIDEEQRFGVSQKEFLKKMRAKVDVLTMTATPIPRTLYMALTGVRDISNINTPPYDRIPITTYVGAFSEKLIRQAIKREKARNGQAFFVHNRVQSIYAMKRYLENLVPDVTIGVAHGQMAEKELSAVMDRFYNKELDVLLCTSIIESGLDVPNANTLIVSRADLFGLAQLYQIRGRVGRSTQRAYAYFFRQKTHKPTEAGLERLDVIAENTQFGAGYTIAMRDLEMRGAGEILGNRQHGSIAAVGFNLYTRMLAQAVRSVRTLRDMDISDEDLGITREMAYIFNPITVEMPLEAGIPETYIEDDQTRIKLYRRLASVNQEDELEKMKAEFADRFGALPGPVENLFFQVQLKIIADRIGLAAVVQQSADVILRFPPLPHETDVRPLPQFGRNVRTLKNGYRIMDLDTEDTSRREILIEILRFMEKRLKKAKSED